MNEEFEKFGFFESSEIEEICTNHIENEKDPYTEEQVLHIIKWIEETRLQETLLDMVLDGMLDIVFTEEGEENEILFTSSEWIKKELGLEDEPEGTLIQNFLNIEFGEKE